MSIIHIQETRCYCCGCKKENVLGKVKIVDGAEFCKYNPVSDGWTRFILHDVIHYVCPKHTVQVHVVIDGEPYNAKNTQG